MSETMTESIWLPTSNDLRRQCSTKLLEAEKDYWLTTNEMLHGMLGSIWEAAKKGEPVTLQRGTERLTLTPAVGKSEA
jgi:hypothetical protein